MGNEIVKAFIATTDEIPVFGGVRLTQEALETFAEALRTGAVPMLDNHDPLRPIDAKVLLVEIRETETGSRGVWVEVEVPEGSMEGMRGFSYGASVVLDELGPGDAPAVGLFADPGQFSEEEILEAAARLAERGLRVQAGGYLQFAIDPGVVVVLSLGLDLLVSVGGAAIWDAIKGLVHPGKRTEVRLNVKKPDGTKVNAVVRTADPEVAQNAIDTLGSVAEGAGALLYKDGEWQDPALEISSEKP